MNQVASTTRSQSPCIAKGNGVWHGLSLQFVLASLLVFQGCAAFHPVRGVPASYVPDEFMAESREGRRQLDPSLLMRTRPEQHLVSGGDILAIYVPRVLGTMSAEVQEVGIAPPINIPSSPDDPPTIGYPIQVRDDSTIKLPQVEAIHVGGMTLHQVEEAIRRAYTEETQILKPDEAMIMVSLYRAREHRVLIYRQEFSQESQPQSGQGSINYGKSRKGTARVVRLRSGENDVAHALTMAGVDGLPGADAENTLYIIRGRQSRSRACGGSPQPTLAEPVNAPHQPVLMPYPVQQMGYTQQRHLGYAQQMGSPVQSADAAIPQPQYPVQRLGHSAQPMELPIQRMSYPPQQTGYRSSGGEGFAPGGNGVIQQMSGVVGHAATIENADFNFDPMAPASGRSRIALMQHSFADAAVPANTSPLAQPGARNLRQPVPGPSQSIQYGGVTPVAAPATSSTGFGHSFPQQTSGEMLPEPVPVLTPALASPQFQSAPQYPMGSLMQAGPLPQQEGFDGGWDQMLNGFDPTIDNPNVIKIPLRLFDGEQIHFTEQDITLYDGDIVFIESRETEVFYTGGLLGGGQYTLPRDYDLRVLEALSIAESRSQQSGQVNRSIGGISALNQDVSNSASRLLIIRKLCNGQTARIEVDVIKAMKYDHENILVQPGDMLILQYTFPEACAAFTQRFLL
ncbi:MAG: polysaccharide biosynthesis/export family protein, partial [Planctomycetaceae bacterium]|nr:polysaccharide biosynthesis/export family protein [Planctomycetaceae bacterium]